MNWLKKNRDHILLLLILLLAAFLAGFRIWAIGNANAYYTAAVKSMLTSWHNFFYASFDPGGFISVDKPALGLWLQCLFGLVFGVQGWSLTLPEVFCSVISVAVLYKIVKRSFGAAAGLLSALFLALTPIFIAATRTNNLDPSLVMVCLFAVWAAVVASEKGSLKHLILAMGLLGLGFNIKMLQAYLCLPAVVLVYFFAAKTTVKKRFIHLAAAAVVLAAVSFSWSIAVDLTPPDARPYVGSSATNTELGLALGYNGIARVIGADENIAGNAALATIIGGKAGIPNEGGATGVFRIFNYDMAGQASWLFPLAAAGLLALLLRVIKKDEKDKEAMRRQLLLWSGLFVPMYVYFGITGHFHRYYLIMFAPCLAALGGIGVRELTGIFARREDTGKNRWVTILLPLFIAATAAVQVYILTAHYWGYASVFVPGILIGAGLSAAGLIAVKRLKKERTRLTAFATAVGLLGLLAAPAFWAFSPIGYGTNAVIPAAGPAGTTVLGGRPSGENKPGGPFGQGNAVTGGGPGGMLGQDGGVPGLFGGETHNAGGMNGFGDSPIIAGEYMMRHYNGARYLVAVLNAAQAEPIILKYGVGVMTLGGFKGTDKTVSLEEFKAIVEKGDLQYYWMSGSANRDIIKWVVDNGVKVDIAEWGIPSMPGGALYDLSGLRTDQG